MTNFMKFEENPSDPAILLEFSNSLAQDRLHSLACIIANQGLKLTNDHNLSTKLQEQISISGFYSRSVEYNKLGKLSCEQLALDRRNSWQTKNLARQNSTYYVQPIAELASSAKLQQFDFLPQDDYKPMNPSVTNKDNELWSIQRTVNYVIRPDGSYNMRGDSAIRTRNYLCQLDQNLNCISAREILPPPDLPEPLYNLVIGWEDCRAFYWKNSFWCTSTVRELNSDGYCEIVLSKITDINGSLHFTDWQVITPTFCPREHQKNWMPMVVGEDLYFMYSSDPARIIDINGNLVSEKTTHIAADSFRGGTQLLPFNGGWLSLIHETHVMPDNRRRYLHRFVQYDSIGRLSKISPTFFLHSLGIEFAAGIAYNDQKNQLIISFGLLDKESWLLSIDVHEVASLLNYADKVMLSLGDIQESEWAVGQTNQALKYKSIVSQATEISRKAGIKSHEDEVKNWDNLIALYHVTMSTDPSKPVMDVAATKGSSFLPTLERMGYQKLFSVNIDEPSPQKIGNIDYQHGDCTATTFEDNYFGFISCLSVIEHGVDVDNFMKESSRILIHGGLLFVSTDYWHEPVDTFGQTAFGAPVKVFTPADIATMVGLAKKYGLELVSNIDLTCYEKVVNWIGMDYTFINLLFRKTV